MKSSSFDALDIFKAQFSNKSAEKCKDMTTLSMVVIMIAIVFITVFPCVNQRVKSGLNNSAAQYYPGFGAALINTVKSGTSFFVEDETLVSSIEESIIDSGTWKVVFTKSKADDYLSDHLELKKESSIIFSEKSVIVNCPATGKTLAGKYNAIPDFSSRQIQEASKDTDTMVLYIQALLFALSTAEIPSAILIMILLISFQTVLFIVAVSFMLSYSKTQGSDKTHAHKKYGFVSSMKIISAVAILPALAVSGVSYFNPSFGLSLGWILYSFALGLRGVLIYLGRVKGRDTRDVV